MHRDIYHVSWTVLNCGSQVILYLYLMMTLKGMSGIKLWLNYRQISNIRRTLIGNKIVDHSDVVGASAVGAAPTTSSFST